MANEKPLPLPLSGEEVQNAILFKVQESLAKTCHLKADNAYTSFKAEIHIKLVLSDYGREVGDNHAITAEETVPLEGTPEYVEDHALTMEPEPPNTVRIESEQPVPVTTTEAGKTVTKNLRYSARKAKVK